MRALHVLGILAILGLTPISALALDVPGADGSDGAFEPTASIEIDLGLADTAGWDQPNPVGNAGEGVYDVAQWAIVFRYTNVVIPSGVTVTFKNHPSGAPVVWLVSGDVDISGVLSLDGKNGVNDSGLFAEGGPGGFRGATITIANREVSGFGPGAARDRNGDGDNTDPNELYSIYGLYAGFYGNSEIIPLIGGTGGSPTASNGLDNGIGDAAGGGGGGVLIAAAGTIAVNGTVRANGGIPAGNNEAISRGSGGAIRLVAESMLGSGDLSVTSFDAGGLGRIRLEANQYNGTIRSIPYSPIVPAGTIAKLWPDLDFPTVSLSTIGGQVVPMDPRADGIFLPGVPEISLASIDPVIVEVAARNVSVVPDEARVIVRFHPTETTLREFEASPVSGDLSSSIWQVSIPASSLPTGAYWVQVTATTD